MVYSYRKRCKAFWLCNACIRGERLLKTTFFFKEKALLSLTQYENVSKKKTLIFFPTIFFFNICTETMYKYNIQKRECNLFVRKHFSLYASRALYDLRRYMFKVWLHFVVKQFDIFHLRLYKMVETSMKKKEKRKESLRG